MRIALFQGRSGIDPARNAAKLVDAVERASAGGAAMLFTPEMSGLLDRNPQRAATSIVGEDRDLVLVAVREAAARFGIWVALGSLAVADADGRWRNRSFVFDALGDVRARYDKMHLFDVDLGSESWRESARYAAGAGPAVVDSPLGRLGLSICYDLRFPLLYVELAKAGATLLAVPAAFTVPTGRAHWHVLLRARAIENGAFVIAAAQCGEHEDGRRTFGHSLVIDPWGEVLVDMGEAIESLAFADLDSKRVEDARTAIPAQLHARPLPAATAS